MSILELQEDVIGAAITATVVDRLGQPIAIDSASIKKLIFKRPDGTVVEKDAEYVTTGVDGKIKYVTLAGDMTPPGTWRYQAYVIKSGTMNGKSRTGIFVVKPNLAVSP